MKNSKKTQGSPKKVRTALASTRPSKSALKHAIKKSLKKNKKTLKILSER